jgi:hypothetical protein
MRPALPASGRGHCKNSHALSKPISERNFGLPAAPDLMEARLMRVPQFAKRSLAALALAVVAGCGKDSNAPDAPFDPAGTSTDIDAMQSSFDSPAMSGYVAASGYISAALGSSPAALAVRSVPTKALIAGGKPAAKHYAAVLAQTYMKPAGEISPSFAAIPAEYLGVTFIYNVETAQYEASALPGAPANGVRFMIYAVNQISGALIVPLVEVGYADVVTTETASSATVRIQVVSAGVTYLDYTVGATGGTSQVTLTISGFVSNGNDRVNFDLDTHITATSVGVDYTLTVPTRGGFRIDFEGESTESTVTSTLEARGPHGTVTISGSQTGGSATYEVEVNGEAFATITTSVSGSVITGADGQPLTQEELQALERVFAVFVQGFLFFGDLMTPMV